MRVMVILTPTLALPHRGGGNLDASPIEGEGVPPTNRHSHRPDSHLFEHGSSDRLPCRGKILPRIVPQSAQSIRHRVDVKVIKAQILSELAPRDRGGDRRVSACPDAVRRDCRGALRIAQIVDKNREPQGCSSTTPHCTRPTRACNELAAKYVAVFPFSGTSTRVTDGWTLEAACF